jgi:hypothetical protein
MTAYGEEPVRNQNADFSLFEQEFSASALVWQDDHDDVRLSAGVRHQGIETSAVLPDSGIPFPEDLWNVTLGVSYRYLFDSGLVLGGSVSVGSASDQPFHSSQELVESISVFVKLPSGERNAWLFGLGYSNNREYANSYPIPVVEYFINPSPDFHAMLGFPMELLEWRPIQDVRLHFVYSLVHNIHALASYEGLNPLQVYLGFDWNTQGYLLVDRADPADRLFYDEKRAKAGLRLDLGRGWKLDLSGGFAFGRSYHQSDHGFRHPFDRVEVASGFYGLASLDWQFGHARDRFEAPADQD